MYRFALIGCGKIARLHAEVIPSIGKLVAVCDRDKDRAESFGRTYGAAVYTDPEDLLRQAGEFDVVCVCTPNGAHAEHVIKALQAGCHVLCEAPLCLTKAGAWQIIETEKYCNRRLFVVSTARSEPQIRELRNTIAAHTNGSAYQFELFCSSGAGDMQLPDWRATWFPGGGALYSEFSNYIDMLVYLFGEIGTVHGTSSNEEHRGLIEFEDQGEAIIQMKTGIEGRLRWALSDASRASLSVSRLKIPLQMERLEEVLRPTRQVYERVYQEFASALGEDGNRNQLFEAVKTVESIEKIYKAVSLNPS